VSEFDEETEYLDAIYNVSKGSNKKKSYTKQEVAGAYLGASGVAAGASTAALGGMKVRDAKQELRRVPRNVPFDATKQRSIRYPGWRPSSAEDQTNRIISRKQVLRSNIRGGNKLKAAGLGLAGLGGAGLVASEASAYNRNKVSKGSTKKNSVGPYTKTDIAAQMGAATGIGAGAGIALKANDRLSGNKIQLNSLPQRYINEWRPTLDPNDTFNSRAGALAAEKNNQLKNLKRGLRTDIRVNSNIRRAGIGLAGLGAAGMLASDVSSYNRNKRKNVSKSAYNMLPKGFSVARNAKDLEDIARLAAAAGIGTGAGMIAGNAKKKRKNMKVSKSAYNMLPKGLSAARKAKALEMASNKFILRASDAYERKALSTTKGGKSAYNMLPKGFSASRKVKALEMAPDKFSAKKQAAYDRMGFSETQGDIADIAGAGVLGAGIAASLPPMYRKRDKMAAARKAKKVSKAFTLTGEKGDKRNSKYAAGAYLGAASGASAGLRLGARSAGTRYGIETQKTADNLYRAVSNTQAGRKITSGMEPIKGLKAMNRGRAIGAVAGTAIGLGAVGAARKMNRNKMAPVAKSAFGVDH